LHFGGKTIIISLLLLGIVSSDRYIISYYDTIEHVGIYNQLYKFSELSIGAVIMVLYGFINPILTVKFEKNLIKSDKLILKYFVMISLISIPIIVILSVFAKPISAILFHESFAKYYYLIPFILISAYLYGLVNLIELKLKFENKMNIIILFYSICLIMNIILNVFFIPKYGFQFAALSTLITYIIMLVFFYWYYMLKVKLQ
jgi:O-antigen/teichoic acid export membrane protein